MKQLRAAFETYYKDAAVVHIGDCVDFRQTDKQCRYLMSLAVGVKHH